ncbi:DUF5063 domain-containing protein [candidate division CSSED10-310 bacterium]|uniref:DUF5063 domain-containing protein n=1 Tax=candidate division CSSED10-310 bacterium TaxID=2855610 RepID=A0ABV6Z655_UNCC1
MTDFDERDFVSTVREYIALIEGASDLRAYDILAQSAILLPKIYAAGMTIQESEPETEEPRTYDGPSVMGTLLDKFGKYDEYFEIFDPTEDKDRVVRSLADDFADIYTNLKGPLDAYDQNQCSDALWQWRFNLRTHCGDHLVDALRALHRLVNDHMDSDYEA